MKKIDYEELYELLYNMQSSKNMEEVANKMYWSISKVSKKIKLYENLLNLKLYIKSNHTVLSESGVNILREISAPLEKLRSILEKEDFIGVDENLIEEDIGPYSNIKYMDSQKLVNNYNLGLLNKIIVSSDYEDEIRFKYKEFIQEKAVYFIKNKNSTSNVVYANDFNCPITKKLKAKNIAIDEYLTQSTAICKVVREGLGVGYTFSTLTLNDDDIYIEKKEEIKVIFNLYTK